MPVPLKFPGVYVQESPAGPHLITGGPTAVTVFVGPTRRGSTKRAVRVGSFADYEQQLGGPRPWLETDYAVWQYFLNGGTDAWVVRVAQKPNLRQIQAGLRAVDTVDLFNLLVLPGVTAPEAVALAADYCLQRRAFLIVDAPADAVTPAQIQAWLQGSARSADKNAALYYPWLKITDPRGKGQPRLSPPSGTIAGMIARTDATSGVWKAPAGTHTTMQGVVGLAYALTDAENGQLNPNAINCLRAFPENGFVAWGARTLAGVDQLASEWKYIPVRRTALFIEESVIRGIQWAVFEPNGEPLWAQLRLAIGAFMQDLFRQGALQGRVAKEGYAVKCDRETTTQNDIANGVLNLEVLFAPLKPAEFVVIKLQLKVGAKT